MGAAAPVQDGALDAQVLGSPRQEVEATGLEVPLDRSNLLSTHRNNKCKQTRNAARPFSHLAPSEFLSSAGSPNRHQGRLLFDARSLAALSPVGADRPQAQKLMCVRRQDALTKSAPGRQQPATIGRKSAKSRRTWRRSRKSLRRSGGGRCAWCRVRRSKCLRLTRNRCLSIGSGCPRPLDHAADSLALVVDGSLSLL